MTKYQYMSSHIAAECEHVQNCRFTVILNSIELLTITKWTIS